MFIGFLGTEETIHLSEANPVRPQPFVKKEKPHPDGLDLPIGPKREGYLSDEEFRVWKEEQKNAASERLLLALTNLCDEKIFKAWAENARRFHHYSWLNTILIWMQFPTYERVASLKTWNSMKRRVIKGEKGILVWYPVMKWVHAKDEYGTPQFLPDGKPKMIEVVVSFRLGRVFDVSQTEGEPLPALPMPVDYHTEDKLSRLGCGLIRDNLAKGGIVVNVADLKYTDGGHGSGPKGVCHLTNPPSITIHQGLSSVDHFAVMLHEAAHALIHSRSTFDKLVGVQPLSYREGELIAEGSAAIVLGTLGYDISTCAVPYLGFWLGQGPGGVDNPSEEAIATTKSVMNEMLNISDILLGYLAPVMRETAVDPSLRVKEVAE